MKGRRKPGPARPPVGPAGPRAGQPHILIACMPKSGSTFLADVIAALPGFQRAPLVPVAGRREQELDETCLRKADPLRYVAQVHVRNNDWTQDMRRDYGLTTVVLVRSLFDIVVSLRDHLRRESPSWPAFFAEAHHGRLDDAALERMIVRLALPWYVNFYMGWRRAPDVLMVDYRQVAETPGEVVSQIMAFAGAAQPTAEIETAIARVRRAGASRFNVGIAGRGRALRPETVQAALELVALYPEAAGDPYVQALQAEGRAILSGAPVPQTPAAPLAGVKRRRRRKPRSFALARLLPAALVAAAILYAIWPADLAPDNRPYGHIDDAAVLLLFSFLAGRFTKHRARRLDLRPERP